MIGSWSAADGSTGTGWRFPGKFSLGANLVFTSGIDNVSSQIVDTAANSLLSLGGSCTGLFCIEPSHSQVLKETAVLAAVAQFLGAPTRP